MKRLLMMLSLATLLLLLGVSCSKERFDLFDDKDCITTEALVKFEMPFTELPGKGGEVRLTPHIYKDVTYYQFNKVLRTEQIPIIEFVVTLISAPEGVAVANQGGDIVFTLPANQELEERQVVIAVMAEGVTREFTFKQLRSKYRVDVEIQ